MSTTDKIAGRAEDAAAQIARLRDQVEMLMKDRVTPMLADAAGRVESAAHDAQKKVKVQTDALAGQVRHRPVAALLLATALGILIGRAIR